MPLAIEITLNILWIPLVFLIAFLIGFIFRSAQLHKLKGKIFQLEKQSLHADAEILMLQKENAQLQEQLKNNPAPVIPLTPKESSENLPDTIQEKNCWEKLLRRSIRSQ